MNSRCLPTICATGHRASRRHWPRAHIELDGSPQPDTSAGDPCHRRVTPHAQLLFVGCQAPTEDGLVGLSGVGDRGCGWRRCSVFAASPVPSGWWRRWQGSGSCRCRVPSWQGNPGGRREVCGSTQTDRASSHWAQCAGTALRLARALGPAQDGTRLGRCRCNAQPRHRPVCRRQLGVTTVALWVIIS